MKDNKKSKFGKKKASNREFLRVVEKRVRKFARQNKIFSKGDKIAVNDSLDAYFVNSIAKNRVVKIYKTKQKGAKTVKLWTADDEINHFLKELFYGKKIKQEKFIKLLKRITDEEASKFARIKGIKFKPNKKDRIVQGFVDEMQKRYPDTKHKLIKGIEIIKSL